MPLDLEKIDLGGFGISEEDAQPELNTQVRANMDEALKVNPDAHAKVTQLSQKSDIPEFAVESDPEKVEHGLKLDNIDFNQMSKRNPNTAKYLTDFNNSVIAQDDIDVLQSIEDIFDVGKTFENIGESITTGFSAQGAGLRLAGADMTPDRIQDLIPLGALPVGIPVQEAQLMSTQLAENLGITTDEQLQEAKKEGVDKLIVELRELQEKRKQLTPEDLNLLEQGVRAGVESLANMAPGTALMLLTGGRAAPLLFTIGAQTFSGSYGDARAEGLPPQEAAWFASIDAAIEVGTEMLPTKTLETIIMGKSTGMTKAALKFVVQEMGTEQLATLGQSINSYAFDLDEEMEQAESVEDMIQIQLRRQAVTAIATVVAGGAQVTAATGLRKGIEALTQDDNKKQTQGDIEQQKINRLNEQSEKSKLRERDKESFKQFVQDADGENNTNVFIDGAQTALYLQSKTREEIEADAALKLLDEQAREASQLGTDVQVPVADFAAEIAGTDHYAELRDSMTMSDETTSPFRQEQVTKETETYVKNLMEEAQESASEYVEAQEIYTQVRDQLIDTGAVTPANASIMAQIVPAWATAQAARQGKTVQQVYQDSGLVIEGPQTGERARLEGEMILEQEPTPVEMQQFVDVAKEVSTGAEFISKAQTITGIPNEVSEWFQNKYDPEGNLGMVKASQLFIDDVVAGAYDKTGVFKLATVEQRATLKETEVPTDEISEQQDGDRGRAAEQQAIIEEAKARTEEQGLSEYNRAKAGEEVTFVHRSQDQVDKLDDAKLDDISEERTPSAYLGHYLGGNDVGNAQRHGNAVTVHKFKLENPLEISEDAFREYTDGLTHQEAIDKREFLKGEGHDGILVEGLSWVIVFESDTLTELQEEFEDIETFFKQEIVDEKDLVNVHNLSAENILAAEELGGLAAPSLATVRTGVSDFTGFGEISLLASPEFLQDPKARTFDADIYSPRQPRPVYDINFDAYKAFERQLDPDNLGLSTPDIQSLEDTTGADNLQRSTAVEYYWLQSQGKAPKLKKAKVDPVVKKAEKLGLSHVAMVEDSKFIKMVTDHYQSVLDDLTEKGFDIRVEKMTDWYFNEDGTIKLSKLRDTASSVMRHRESGGFDVHKLRDDIYKKMRVKKTRNDYDQWVTDKFNSMVTSKKLFKGFTPSGNRKYVDYNLQNVVKEMTHQLQAGEGFFYGVGTVRSAYANEMKTIKQIQAKREEIVSEEDMTKIKEESADVFSDALDKLKPFYKFDTSSFGYGDDVGNAIVEGRKGLNEAFDMTPEAQQIVDDLTEYLSALPTEYFETKFKRDVQFSEFDTAVVPKGTRKDALQVLKDAGLKIKTYDPKDKGSRAQVIAKQKQLLFQDGKQEARGYYDPANSIIRLTEAADLSTFLHEFAHFMYEMEVNGDTEMLQGINNWYKRNAEDVAKEANEYAPNTTILPRHVVAFLDEGTAGDKERDDGIRRAVHEQFARGFETYLMEGKAPSIELRNAFRAFARWLSRIYQALRGQLDVKIDAEMRQVFDRLLATEEQITAAEARARVEPMFTDAAMAGMTEAEFVDYQKRQEKVKDVQSETLRDKIIKQLTRQTEKWWKEEKQDIIDEEIESLSKQQVYEARNRLRDGDIKLDHATVKDMIGEQKEDKLGRKSTVVPTKLRGMTAKGQKGVHPDEAAAFFGYTSGSEMLTDLTTAPDIKVQAEVNAEARMIDRHGDILTDGTIEQEADEAVRNEERGKLILNELKTLAKGTNAPTIERNTIKDLAETNIGKLSFREIHPGKYRKAEIRAAQESATMLAAGNKEGAATAKFRQVMNYYLGMAATNAKNDTVKIVDRMARYNKKKVREEIMKAEGGYWDQIVKILNRFEFRKVATLKEIESLNTWMAERNGEAGDALVLTNSVLNESYVTHWKNVPFSDLQGINDSVKNIEHVARYSNKLTRMQEEIDFNKLVDRWVTSMDENVKTRFVSKRTDVAEGRKWGRWFMAQMTKIPFMASWLDGGERAGISHQIMVQPFTDAYNAEIKLWAEAGKPVMDAIENRSKADRKRHNQKIYIPEIDDNLYGHQIVAVALNTGNQGNLKKMLLGEGWADPEVETEIEFNNPQLQAVLSHMKKSDWMLVQKIWDQMETLYPQLAEVHRRTTGLTPPKVESTPVTVTVDGETIELKGGYYPVKYDPNRSHKAALNEDKLNAETESMFSNSASIQAAVNTGATNERTGYYAPIRLSLDVVPAHFQETIHYITHHDAVREVNRLTRNKQVAQTIKEKLGPEEYAQLRPWLNDIAKDGREAPTKMFWDDMLQKLRFGVTLGTMGFKASTGIIQISGLSNSVAEVGVGNMMQSMRSILGSTTTIKQAWDFAVENSQVLEHRVQTMDREIKNAMKRIEGKRGVLAAAQEASMKHIALIQAYMVDLPSWHAAYIKGMTDWGDETRAFQYADWVIENVQGSGATKDMARIMRSQAETGRMFTMFMTFFSSLWNMERDLVKGAKTGRYSTTNVAAKVMFLFTIPVIFEMMMRGELGEPEDEDDRLQQMLTKVALFPVQSIPFIRDIASATTGEFGYNISPLQSIIEQGTRTLPELITRGFTDDEITKGQVKGATKFIGATLGIPGMNQMWATGEHLYEVIEDGEEFTTRELLFGPDYER